MPTACARGFARTARGRAASRERASTAGGRARRRRSPASVASSCATSRTIRVARVRRPRREMRCERARQPSAFSPRHSRPERAAARHRMRVRSACGRKRAVATLASSASRVRYTVPMPGVEAAADRRSRAPSRPNVCSVRSGRYANDFGVRFDVEPFARFERRLACRSTARRSRSAYSRTASGRRGELRQLRLLGGLAPTAASRPAARRKSSLQAVVQHGQRRLEIRRGEQRERRAMQLFADCVVFACRSGSARAAGARARAFFSRSVTIWRSAIGNRVAAVGMRNEDLARRRRRNPRRTPGCFFR